MPIVKYKPTTPGRRLSSVNKQTTLTKPKLKSLLKGAGKKSGRNNQGRITIRHRGGGAKTKQRLLDFKRDKFDVPAKVAALEYDPGRSANIVLLNYIDGEKRYIIAGDSLAVGQMIVSSQQAVEIQSGNNMPLKYIPAGQVVSNVELYPGGGSKLARSAGNRITLMGREAGMAQLKMPSGEIRLVPENCRATIGEVGNAEHANIRWGKAGRTRHRGRRPQVRGKAMNPVEHPHGGGEGNQPIGMKHPKTPWGKPALGVKTRRKNRASSKLILRRRKSKKR